MSAEAPEHTAIEQVLERFEDLTGMLRDADRPDLAKLLEAQAPAFASATRVRRAVAEVRQLCAHWRTHPDALPELPIIHLAANRLEDACREALHSGVIVAAPPSVAARSKRQLAVAVWTLVAGVLALLVPIALVESKIDITDIHFGRSLAPVTLAQGEETRLEVSALAETLLPGQTAGARFAPANACRQLLRDAACVETQARLWPEGRLATYEIRVRNQAYGLLFALTAERLFAGKVGAATMLLAATDDTPEGRYEIPLTASYLGYSVPVCEPFDRVLGGCAPPRPGNEAEHAGIGVPRVLVDVVRGDPARRLGEKRLAQAKAEEAQQQAAERAQQLAAAISVIEEAMTEVDAVMRKRRWEEARDRLRKLATLFAPLEATEPEAGVMPRDVGAAKVRYEKLQERLLKFESDVFDDAFETLKAPANKSVPESVLMATIARRHRIAVAYVEEIYTLRAEEIHRRLQAAEKARQQQAEAERIRLAHRCGTLPTESYAMVKQYLEELHPEAEVKLGECLTPRLDPDLCWIVRCGYKLKVAESAEHARSISRHSGEFYVEINRVVTHVSW